MIIIMATLRVPRHVLLAGKHLVRPFSTGAIRRSAAGVHPELLKMRVQTPWLTALASKNDKKPLPTEFPKDRKLTGKRMGDSYTSIVSGKLPLT